ncbi:MAG TPA: DinB family protein [Chitinophagaceae bacterium]
MTFMQSFARELEREAITTRKMLERVPTDKFDWQPHEKSMTVRQLATHVAEIPSWIPMVLNTAELDFANTEYKPVMVNTNGELVDFFEKSFAEGKAALAKSKDKQLEDFWTMRSGEQIYSTSPKDEVLRGVFCQVVHHRAQLGVYLRLLNVPIPGSYGPSADEPNF